MFTWVQIYCQRLDRAGVGPGAVFGLRFPLYVMFAGGFAALGFDHKETVPTGDIAVMVIIGLALTVPPLYALQRAIASVSTLTIGTLTALGPVRDFCPADDGGPSRLFTGDSELA